jgi:diketogulonate reductase-like aldo/keto reductase
LRWPNVISIPKSSRVERVQENAQAADLVLSPEDLAALDKAFPPPKRATPLGSL